MFKFIFQYKLWICIVFFFNLISLIICENNKCAWYGQCDKTDPDKIKNCKYTGPPKSLNNKTAIKILSDICPQYTRSSSLPKVCCDPDQIITLAKNLSPARILFGSCPNCMTNFVRLFCGLTCDPNQDNFLKSVEIVQNAITKIQFNLSNTFYQGLYNSCSGVVLSSSNSFAVDTICATTHEKCTNINFYKGLGDGSKNAPFDIEFIDSNSDTAMNQSIIPCNEEGGPNNGVACSCQDCPAVCKPRPTPSPPALPFTVLGLDGWYFVVGLLLILFIIGLISACIIILVCRRKYSEKVSDETHSSEIIYPRGLDLYGAKLESALIGYFYNWGKLIAYNPKIVITISLLVSSNICCGIMIFTITTNPVELWSAPTSTARLNKDYFDEKFGPFYRTEQIFIVPKNKTPISRDNEYPRSDIVTYGPVFNKSILAKVGNLQNKIVNMKVKNDKLEQSITLSDICFKPLSPDNNNCLVTSVMEYFQGNVSLLNKTVPDETGFFTVATYMTQIIECIQDPSGVSKTKFNESCYGSYGGPIFPYLLFGGFKGKNNFTNSTGLVINFLVRNSIDQNSQHIKLCEAWEKAFLDVVKEFADQNSDLEVSYQAERSVQDEINRQSEADISTIAISYIIMFIYVTLALGKYQNVSNIPVDLKASIGLIGVSIVLISVAASVGFWSYCGVPLTLIIIEVVPFLVLAVGVDNLFILVQTYQRHEVSFNSQSLSPEEKIARVVAKVGPSMLLSSVSESLAFFCGAMTTMPAVRVFSLYAATAVLFDFLLQMTFLVAVFLLDIRRTDQRRMDLLCCIKFPKKSNIENQNEFSSDSIHYSGILHKLFDKYYAPFLMKDWVRILFIILIVSWNAFAFASIHKIPVELNQELSMPKDSYMINYFNALSNYLSVGPPVYFVVKEGHDYTTLKGQNQICSTSGCDSSSLLAQISMASKLPERTSIATPGASWLDDFFVWIKPNGDPPCCRIYPNQSFCPATSSNKKCTNCPVHLINNSRPDRKTFDDFLLPFLSDNPGAKCPKGGHAAYGAAVNLKSRKPLEIGATYFMTYHTVLKVPDDYTNALKRAMELADSINRFLAINSNGDKTVKVFPYSIFYVFYEQYLTVFLQMWYQLAICLFVILLVSFVLLGLDWKATLIIGLNIILIMNSMFGLMYLWSVPINALSLVNLVMAIGISVEFISHIVRAYVIDTHHSRLERARSALVEMGSSVLSGITLTKLGGIIVLAFSKSQLFQIFYFRMYFGIVLFGAIHGLIFLPIFLSYLGPSLNKAKLVEQKKLLENIEVTVDNRKSLLSTST